MPGPPPSRHSHARRPAPGRPTARRRTVRRGADPVRRIQGILLVSLFVLSLIGGRLVQLQGLDGTAYSKMAEAQRLHEVTLTAPRGPILDRDGRPLAETVDARDVYADPEKVTDPAREAAQLAPVLGDPPGQLASSLAQNTTFVYLAQGVTPALADRALALQLPGVGSLPAQRRIYPAGDLASNVVGVVGASGDGLAGLEYSFNDSLAGHDGTRTFETGLSGSPIPDGENVVKPAVPGTGLELTIQRDIQWEAQRALSAQVKATRADSGTAIVMNPRNGQILALAVSPSFDPNRPPTSIAELGDPAISDVYEPGSVNKVITMSAALQEHVATPTSPYTIPPLLHYAGTTFRDAEPHGVEHLTLTGILAKSSNIGTIEVARRLGAAVLYHYLRAYGFGSPTGIGLPGDSAGLLPPLASWTDTTLPTAAFGQGVGVTALQVASVYSTIANGGVRVTPNLVQGTVGPGGAVTPAPRPEQHRVITAKVAKQLSDMLESVTTNEGTAPLARIPGYRIAGKTGTAMRPNGTGGYAGYTASFVGYAPADDPKLLVEVVLQKPRTEYFGGLVAAPVFHDIMSFALQSLKIPPTGTKPPVAKLTW